MFRRLWSTINRPLPAWLTLVLVLGTSAAASTYVLNGSVLVPSGGSITDSNAGSGDVVTTTTGGKLQYGAPGSTLQLSGTTLGVNPNLALTTLTAAGTIKSQPAANTNATLQMTASGTGVANADFASVEPNNFITLEDDAAGIGSLVNIGEIYAKTPNGNCGGQTIAHIDLITAGNAATPGGAITFHTSDDSGSCVDHENLVLPHDHHVYMPYDQWYHQWNTPASCAALVPCGTITWNFTFGYHNTSGALSVPDCPSGLIEDDNNSGVTWFLSVAKGGLSAIGVVYNYTPLTATSSATTLEAWAMCHSSSF